jgi:hypothetical protein
VILEDLPKELNKTQVRKEADFLGEFKKTDPAECRQKHCLSGLSHFRNREALKNTCHTMLSEKHFMELKMNQVNDAMDALSDRFPNLGLFNVVELVEHVTPVPVVRYNNNKQCRII